jgi:NADH:ubiquinone oxidoreductase subunit E
MEIKVCIGSACHLKGSYDVIKKIQGYLEEHKLEDRVTLKSSFCLGHCSEAVSVQLDDKIVSMSPETVNTLLKEYFER